MQDQESPPPPTKKKNQRRRRNIIVSMCTITIPQPVSFPTDCVATAIRGKWTTRTGRVMHSSLVHVTSFIVSIIHRRK